MVKLITVKKAEEEITRLQEYIDLVESYEVNSLDSWIIKEYATTNSMKEIIKKGTAAGMIQQNGEPVDHSYVVSVINGKASDKLHRLIKSGYRLRIKPSQKAPKK
ncbi:MULTISPECIES: hypothetical protein [Bacillaceae]|uniref:hypothetical protein n=1 Tax=Bacillaceae TaxID=186817 RepID=UPI00077CADC4|nr:hypothetical protein [Rossellomorea vietnamensis]MBN8194200.1 hypothetical protein [Bacillus sp. NTK074B]